MDEEEALDTSQIKLTLRENAYEFIGESLTYAEIAVGQPRAWKFAVVLASQAIELLLKARLEAEHPLLVRADLNKVGKRTTVNMEAALVRLESAGVWLDPEDIKRLRRARDLRNEFMHYEVNASVEQIKGAYTDLFEFAHIFHEKELDSELHDHLSEELWPAEAAMMEHFRRHLVMYQGSEVVSPFPSEIVEAQFVTHYVIEGVSYPRIRRGEPNDLFDQGEDPCSNCTVLKGQYHVFACCEERCPRCDGQFLGCGCPWDDPDESEGEESS